MIYSNLIANQNIINNLNNYIYNNKIPNAFLFYGPEGTGKFGHALEFCATLLCTNKYENKSACGECISCNKIKNNIHENIKYIYPISSSKTNENSDTIQDRIQIDSKSPYIDLKFTKNNSIPISSIRDIKKSLSLSNINNDYQIHLIIESEKLCFPRQESANALLKILEEPTENNLFILLSSNHAKIIDTIKSRSTQIYFPKIKIDAIENYLSSTVQQAKKEDCNEIANLCNGNIIEAKKLIDDYSALKLDLNKLIKIIYNNEFSSWIKFTDRNKKIDTQLNLLKLFFLDIILMKNNNKNHIKLNSFLDIITKYISKFPNVDYEKIINDIDMFHTNKSKNVYLPLSLMDLFINIQSSLNKKY